MGDYTGTIGVQAHAPGMLKALMLDAEGRLEFCYSARCHPTLGGGFPQARCPPRTDGFR